MTNSTHDPRASLSSHCYQGMVVAIKSQDQWAVWAIEADVSDVLFRPGVLEFQGPALEWLQCIPGHMPGQPLKGTLLGCGARPEGGLAPSEDGLMIIDYDAKAYYGCQNMGSDAVFNLAAWGSKTKQATSPSRQWARPLLEKGYLPFARWEDGLQTPVPREIPQDILWVEKFLEGHFRRERGMDPAPMGFPDCIELPLTVPGWEFTSWVRGQTEHLLAESFLLVHQAYGLSQREKELWQEWAVDHEQDALFRAVQASLLDDRLEPVQDQPRRPRF